MACITFVTVSLGYIVHKSSIVKIESDYAQAEGVCIHYPLLYCPSALQQSLVFVISIIHFKVQSCDQS